MRLFLSVLLFVALAGSVAGAGLVTPWNVEPLTEPQTKEMHLRNPVYASAPAESIHQFNVLHYTLDLSFAMTSDYLEGTSSVLCESREAGLDSIVLNCVGLNVDSITLSGKQLLYTLAGGNIYVDLDSSFQLYDTFEVTVAYNGHPASGYYWYEQGATTPDTTAYTSTEPSDSRYWFPCFDEPWDKADMGSTVIGRVPLGYVVASNGILASVDTAGNTVSYTWQENRSIATYLVMVAITKYAVIPDQYVNSLGDTIPIQHYVYRSDSVPAVVNFAKVPEMMEYYSSIFGEYPFEKYGHAVVQPFWGGMEHQTITTILRWAAVNGWESGVAHELAHQWWGDMVTCFTWPDIWINEGFATYTEALWAEYEYGVPEYHANMLDKAGGYFEQDSTWRFAIYDPPVLFNWGIVYCKGAWVLHMLRHVMPSDSIFFAIFPDYGETFKFGNASVEDFRQKAEEHYGGDLGWYFQEWIYDQGHPQYNYAWASSDLGGGDYEIALQIEQIQIDAPPVFEMPVDLRVLTLSYDTTIVVWNDAAYQEFRDTLTLPAAPTGISFDPDNWILDEHWQVPFGIAEENRRIDAAPRVFRAAPNPFRESVTIVVPTGPVTSGRSLEVLDVAGRRVRQLSLGPDESRVVWEGLDDLGRPLAGGLYFVRTAGSQSTLKLLKID
jgi:aminopeptidase N